MIWLAYSIVWLSCALAVCCGLYFTKDVFCLFFMILPLFVTLKTGDKNKNKNKELSDENR